MHQVVREPVGLLARSEALAGVGCSEAPEDEVDRLIAAVLGDAQMAAVVVGSVVALLLVLLVRVEDAGLAGLE